MAKVSRAASAWTRLIPARGGAHEGSDRPCHRVSGQTDPRTDRARP